MRKSVRSWLTVVAVAAVTVTPVALSSGVVTQAAASTGNPTTIKAHPNTGYLNKHAHINCRASSAFCTEVANSRQTFGYYVGHDEPSVLFNSYTPGSGNHMRYNVILPTDPTANNPNQTNKSYQFELSGADWFGMVMCDTQSYPEQVKTCPPDSDKNILDPTSPPSTWARPTWRCSSTRPAGYRGRPGGWPSAPARATPPSGAPR